MSSNHRNAAVATAIRNKKSKEAELVNAIEGGSADDAPTRVKELLDQGVNPQAIVQELNRLFEMSDAGVASMGVFSAKAMNIVGQVHNEMLQDLLDNPGTSTVKLETLKKLQQVLINISTEHKNAFSGDSWGGAGVNIKRFIVTSLLTQRQRACNKTRSKRQQMI